MHDMKPLEKEWQKYQIKKRKPWYLFIFITLCISVLSYYVFYNSKDTTNIFDIVYQKLNSFSKNTMEEDSQPIINSILVNGRLTKLEVIDSMKIIEDTNSNSSSSELLVDIPILDIHAPSNESKETTKKAKVYIDIFETTSMTAYKDVEERFKQTADIDDALFLAKSYYKKSNYEKSEYWALETNKLDSSLEESFFIFVKSKFKLGKINEAVSILSTYMKQTNSREAKILLEQLKNNTL